MVPDVCVSLRSAASGELLRLAVPDAHRDRSALQRGNLASHRVDTALLQQIPTSWPAYVSWVAQQYSDGLDGAAIAQKINDTRVSWEGRVHANRATSDLAPSITLDMEPVELRLPDGRIFVGDYLALPIRDEVEKSIGSRLSVGDPIRFTATIGDEDGFFAAIDFADDPEQNKVFVETALHSVHLMDAREGTREDR